MSDVCDVQELVFVETPEREEVEFVVDTYEEDVPSVEKAPTITLTVYYGEDVVVLNEPVRLSGGMIEYIDEKILPEFPLSMPERSRSWQEYMEQARGRFISLLCSCPYCLGDERVPIARPWCMGSRGWEMTG